MVTKTGNGGDNTLTGTAGADVLRGLGGTDKLLGGSGIDSLFGGSGRDILKGDRGADFLDGGDDADTVTYEGSATGLTVDFADPSLNTGEAAGDSYVSIENMYGSRHADRLFGNDEDNAIAGLYGNDRLSGRGGNDRLAGGKGADILDGGDGIDTLFFAYLNSDPLRNERVVVALDGSFAAGGTSVGDTFVSIENVRGSSKNDRIAGNSDANKIEGFTGKDSLSGRGGDDRLEGGDDEDKLNGEGENDVLRGGGGKDELDGEDGDDDLDGGSGDDLIDSGEGIDSAKGGSGKDKIYGRGGNDNLNGGTGDDTIAGGAGADTINGGDGSDTLYFSSTDPEFTSDIVVSLDNSLLANGLSSGDTFTSIENIQGRGGNDLLAGNSGKNRISGDDGDDRLFGRAGADKLAGDDGADSLYGEEDADSLAGGAKIDTLYGGGGKDSLDGGSGNDYLSGGAGSDVFDGGTGTDTVFFSYGGEDPDEGEEIILALDRSFANTGTSAGDTFTRVENVIGGNNNDKIAGNGSKNVIEGRFGNDELFGRGGNDTLIGGEGNNTLRGEGGNDLLDGNQGVNAFYGGAGTDTVDYSTAPGSDGIGGYIILDNMFLNSGFATDDSFDSIENVIGSASRDYIYGSDGDNRLEGRDGNDFLLGVRITSDGELLIDNDEGADNVLIGGAGNDTLWVGSDMRGGTGDDDFRLCNHENEWRIRDFEADNGVDDRRFDKLVFYAEDFIDSGGTGIDYFSFLSSPDKFFESGASNSDWELGGSEFFFNQTNNTLWYDQDGSGSQYSAIKIMTLNDVDLKATDLVIYSFGS